METMHPVEGYFGSEFPAICNHCGVMAAWSRKTLKFSRKFSLFWKKRPIMVKLSKLCSESFIATPIVVLCSNFVKFGRREVGESVRCMLTWQKSKISPGSPDVVILGGSHPKSAKASPQQCAVSAPDFIQIVSLSAELWPNAWTPPKRAVKWMQYSAEA